METAVPPEGAIATVQEFLRKLHDPELRAEALNMLDGDFVIRQPPTLPYGGDYHGPDGFVEMFTRLTRMVLPEPLGPRTVRDAGDRVLLHDTVRFTWRASGQSVVTDVAEVHKVRDGKMIEIDIYHKSPEAVAALAAG
jgi:ketosteroid isomerase-like protein